MADEDGCPGKAIDWFLCTGYWEMENVAARHSPEK
jgi:hypothetical protein